jgi:membrane fusion protein (multidrug efflux system)
MRVPFTGECRSAPPPGRALPFLGLLALGIALLVNVFGCGGANEAQSHGSGSASAATQTTDEEKASAEDAIAVEVDRVVRASLSSLYSTSATLRADKRATVTARTRGVIRKLLVEEGDWVDAEQPLAILENDEQRIAFEQMSATSETKRRELERAETLHEQGLMSDEEYETTRREAVEARHTADLAELTLSRTVIRATFGGRVLTRHLDPGATVNDGTAVYDIADLDPLYADVQVPERQIAQLESGQTVRLLTDADGSVGEAVIERIAPAVDPSTGTVKVTVSARTGGDLRPGSFVRVGIVTDTHPNALVVPRSALVAEGRTWHVFRLKEDDDDAVELVEVTRGFEENDQVEIFGVADDVRPLNEGDRIVVTGASSLSDGSIVQIMEESDSESGEPGVAA